MRNIMTTLGLAGLLECGSAETSSLPEETSGEKTEQVYAAPVTAEAEGQKEEVQMNFQPDCPVPVKVQRAALFNDFPLSLYGDSEERERQTEEARRSFATTVSDLAEDLVNGSYSFKQLEEPEAQSFYRKAKNLAGCMEPTLNFDKEVVAAAYKSATKHAEQDSHDGLAEADIEFANGVAGPADIDVKPYAIFVVEAAYKSATKHAERDSHDGLAEADIEFAKQIATEAQLPDQLQKLTALEATLQ